MLTIQPLNATQLGLDAAWDKLGKPGTWWAGAQRVTMAAQTRAARECDVCARRKLALSPYAGDQTHHGQEALGTDVVDAIHRLSSDPGRITERWYTDLLATGLEPEEVVEMVGVVSVVSIADTLSAALNQPIRELPKPKDGTPTRERVGGLDTVVSWVPTIDPAQADGEAKAMYDVVEGNAGFVFHVVRALTAVPTAMQDFFTAFTPNYNTHGETAGDLTRSQVELLATSTSAFNDCFY